MRFKERFEQQGFLHLPHLVDRTLTRTIKQQYLQSVKSFGQPLLRNDSNQYEPHHFSDNGLMTNSLLNVHECTPETLIGFRLAIVNLLGHYALQQLLDKLMGARPVLVQSLYTETNPGNPDQVDSHWVDSAKTGSMIGCWIALEDISADSGRFTLFPQSHLLDNAEVFSGEVAQLYQAYRQQSIEVINRYQHEHPQLAASQDPEVQRLQQALISKSGLTRYTQDIKAGDVFLFSSKLMHGNETPTNYQSSCHTLTAHFVPATHPLRHQGNYDVDLRIVQGGILAMHMAPMAVMA
jgi:phytanoyl-CoA hydroxylase